MRKYRNQPVTIDGISFPSKREANRYGELRLLERAGKIASLRRQVGFPLKAEGGKQVGRYVADFTYYEGDVYVVEDCKGFRTPVYKLKKAWVRAQYGIEIRET